MHLPSLQCSLFLHGISPTTIETKLKYTSDEKPFKQIPQLAADSSAPDLQSSLPSQTYLCAKQYPFGQTNMPKLHGGLTARGEVN
jgi:hypothetical protein